jgi:cell division protein FtsB
MSRGSEALWPDEAMGAPALGALAPNRAPGWPEEAPRRSARPAPARRLRVGRLVVVALVAYLGIVGVRAELQVIRLNGQVASLSRQASQLARQQRSLEAQARLLRQPAYLEQLARTELGYVSKGEIPLVPSRSAPRTGSP